MVEYTFKTDLFTNDAVYEIGRYGKIIRIRASFKHTSAPAAGNTVAFGINQGNIKASKTLFYWQWTARGDPAAGAYQEDMNCSIDTNIDIDKTSGIYYYNTAAATGYVTLDIISPNSSKQRQFHDKLSGINSYET